MGILLKLAFLAVGLGLYVHFTSEKFDPEIIRGKRVLVTGASTGIGEQVAYQYARMGAKVMVTARREAVLKKVVAECKRLSGHSDHHYVTADMSDLPNIPKVTEAVKKSLGGLDILVINHVAPYRPGLWIGKVNLTYFDFQSSLNYNSYVHLATHALPLLEESPGSSIIVVNSAAGVLGFLINSGYAGSKFAIHGFFMSLLAQFRILKQDISITQCFLGAIRTEAAHDVLTKQHYKHERIGKSLTVDVPEDTYMEVNETAYEIVQAGALRQEEMFYPRILKYFTYPGLKAIYTKLAVSQIYKVADLE